MMRRKFIRMLSVGLLFVMFPAGADVTPVYQVDASVGAYLQTTLTHDIYRYSANVDLSDLVVIDSKGNKLPFRITTPDTESVKKVEATPLNFYPVKFGVTQETLRGLNELSIQIQEGNISVDVTKNTVAEADSIDFYLVDISDFKKPVDALLLAWQAQNADQYLEVEVSGTNDLQEWRQLAQDTLVQLEKDGQVLLRNGITLNLRSHEYRYLRLKILRGGKNLQLTAVRAESKANNRSLPAAETWQIEGQLADDQMSALRRHRNEQTLPVAAWEYQRDDIAPVEKLQIALADIAYGDHITIFSRQYTKQPWQLVHQGIWFNAQVGDDWQHSQAIATYPNNNIFWRIELHQSLRGNAHPLLTFTRRTQVLQFIANNAAPFSIAIDDNPSSGNPRSEIFSQLLNKKPVDWITVGVQSLNPDLRKSDDVTTGLNWANVSFWSVLMIAVAVLIGFALRLYKQANQR